jgi:hypothetical protein
MFNEYISVHLLLFSGILIIEYLYRDGKRAGDFFRNESNVDNLDHSVILLKEKEIRRSRVAFSKGSRINSHLVSSCRNWLASSSHNASALLLTIQ